MSLGSQLANGWQSFAVANRDDVDREKRPTTGWQPLKSALLASAGSVIAYPAVAQQTAEPVPLPPLSVEATKKKAAAKKKPAAKKAPTQQVSPAPQAPTQPVAQQADPLPGEAGPPAAGSFNAGYASSAKMTGPLLDTPQTVNVITNAVIQERNSSNLTEALRNVPGISFNAGENGFASSLNNFSIRGFDSAGNIFVDGVRDSGNYARDTFNVDRVEVIKGAAADNGRGGAGGYVNLVTKAPTNDDFVKADLVVSFDDYGTDPLVRSTIDVNQSSGTVAVRLNGMLESGGVMGRDVAEAEAYGVAPSITFGMNTDTRVTVAYERLERQDLPDWGVPGASISGLKSYNPASAGAKRDAFYGLNTDYDDVQGDRVLARVEHDLSPNFVISNQTVWNRVSRDARYTIPFSYTAPNFVRTDRNFYDRVNESFSNQTNLAGTFVAGGFRHTISTGVEFSHEESDATRLSPQQGSNLGNGGTTLFDPNPGRDTFVTPGIPPQSNSVNIDTVAAYFYDTLKLSRHFDLVGGVRVENYDVEINSVGNASGLSNYSTEETTVGGKIGLVYKPVREGSLYASYGVSALPPGSYLSNPDISREGDDAFPALATGAGPIELHNYEIGVKWDFFNGRLSTTAAAFRTEKKDMPHMVRGNPTIFYEEQVVQGIELGVAGNLTERWKAFGGLLVLDSQRKSSEAFNRAACADRPGDYGQPNAGACLSGGELVKTTDGDELAFTPNFTATLWTTYDVTKEFTVGGGVQYVSDSWLGRPDDAFRVIKNGTYGKLPDYFLVNVMASYELTENVDLRLNIDNLFDETYAISTNWGGSRATLGPPRTYRIGTSVDF